MTLQARVGRATDAWWPAYSVGARVMTAAATFKHLIAAVGSVLVIILVVLLIVIVVLFIAAAHDDLPDLIIQLAICGA